MKKLHEDLHPTSCWNKARPDEYTFICLDRDLAMANTIRFWINERIKLGLNKPGDEKLEEAESLANLVDKIQANRNEQPKT